MVDNAIISHILAIMRLLMAPMPCLSLEHLYQSQFRLIEEYLTPIKTDGSSYYRHYDIPPIS